MRAALVGGAGFLGSHLAERITASGDTVLVLDDLSSGRIENLAPARQQGRVGFHTVAVDNPQIVQAIRRFDPDLVYHLAMPRPPDRGAGDPIATATLPLHGVAALCEAAAVCKARLVVAVNATDLYGAMSRLPVRETQRPHPLHVHGAALYAALRYVEAKLAGHWCGLAFGEVYGPNQNPERSLLARVAVAMGEGRTVPVPADDTFALDYVHVADATDALARAATRGAGLLNIGTGVATPFADIVTRLADHTGYAGGRRPIELPYPLPAELSLDSSLAAAKLGWRAVTSLEEGLSELVRDTAQPR